MVRQSASTVALAIIGGRAVYCIDAARLAFAHEVRLEITKRAGRICLYTVCSQISTTNHNKEGSVVSVKKVTDKACWRAAPWRALPRVSGPSLRGPEQRGRAPKPPEKP
jgi:hypothetical protein